MNKILGVLGAFLLGCVALDAASFTNTGSATWWCNSLGLPGMIHEQATGTSFNFDCPPGYITNAQNASVGDLLAQASVGSAPSMFPQATFSLQSKFTDSLLPTGGSGAGVVEFTLTYTWAGLLDMGSVTGGADLSFNGLQVASIEPMFCVTPADPKCILAKQVAVQVIDEPITYGVPFSYQVDDFLSGAGAGLNPSNHTTVSAVLISGGSLAEVPEPRTLMLALIGALAFLLKFAATQWTRSNAP